MNMYLHACARVHTRALRPVAGLMREKALNGSYAVMH